MPAFSTRQFLRFSVKDTFWSLWRFDIQPWWTFCCSFPSELELYISLLMWTLCVNHFSSLLLLRLCSTARSSSCSFFLLYRHFTQYFPWEGERFHLCADLLISCDFSLQRFGGKKLAKMLFHIYKWCKMNKTRVNWVLWSLKGVTTISRNTHQSLL